MRLWAGGRGSEEIRGSLDDAWVDLLSYMQSAAPWQEMGHVSIGADTAHREQHWGAGGWGVSCSFWQGGLSAEICGSLKSPVG